MTNNLPYRTDSLPRAVIFDCDGILVDTEPLHYRAFQEVLAPLGLGHDYARYLEHFIGFDDRDAFLYAFREAGRDLDRPGLQDLVEAKARALDRLIARGVPTFPGVVELVRELGGLGMPLAVASGALRREVLAFIGSLGLDGMFCAIVTADEVQKSKPDPETYLLALQRVGEAKGWAFAEGTSCLAIEDTPAGIDSAKGAGLFVIAVTNSFPKEQLREADHIVDSLSALDYPALARLLENRRSG